MSGSGRTLWKWCNCSQQKSLPTPATQDTTGLCRGQEKDKWCFPGSPHHRGGFTRKNWCSSAECRLRSSDITPALQLFWPLTGIIVYHLSCRQCYILFTHVHLLPFSSLLDLSILANQPGKRRASLDKGLVS